MSTQVVVVTPVRNEARILNRFLSVASQFADLVIVADQNSTDGSQAIYPLYPKVVVVENPSVDYDEAGRQLLLLAEARKRVPGRRLILALDADELLAADAVTRPGWETALNADPGTVVCFEKPDILSPPDRCIRYTRPWPLGYLDDGAAHAPRQIHSIRIPTPAGAPRLNVYDVKVLHFAMSQPDVQRAKMRLYAVIEATKGTARLHNRRSFYAANKDWAAGHAVGPVSPEWFAGWETLGIDMLSSLSDRFYWQDLEVLRYFAQHGTRRYWFDDIWDLDWEACREYGRQVGLEGLPPTSICRPPSSVSMLMRTFDRAVGAARRIRRSLGR